MSCDSVLGKTRDSEVGEPQPELWKIIAFLIVSSMPGGLQGATLPGRGTTRESDLGGVRVGRTDTELRQSFALKLSVELVKQCIIPLQLPKI